MNPIKSLELSRAEIGISKVFPISHLNSPSEFETTNGDVGSTISLKGIPFETLEDATLNMLTDTLNQAFMSVDESMIAYVTTHRKKVSCVLDGKFKSTFSKRLNDKYHNRFSAKSTFKNNYYLTVIVKGETHSKTAKIVKYVEKFLSKKVKDVKIASRNHKSQKLQTAVKMLVAQLSPFRPELLAEKNGENKLLNFLSIFTNGGNGLSFKANSKYPKRSKSIVDIRENIDAYQECLLGHYIGNKRILFGEYIQFQGAAKSSTKFSVMLALKKYPIKTNSNIFDPLTQMDAEYILTHTFAPLDGKNALETIETSRTRLAEVDDKGISQIDDLVTLENNIACESSKLGFHHNSLMLLNRTIEGLEKDITEAVKIYAYSGITLVKETLGAECAYWSQIPGNYKYINRACLITSENFLDYCSFHNYEVGHNGENHLGQAVTVLETSAQTAAFFNWHAKGSKENPAKGAGLIIAPTDAGKTTMINFTCSQMKRFDGRIFYLDRDQASKVYVKAEGGSYTIIHPEQENLHLNPFQLEDNQLNRSFLVHLLSNILLVEGEQRLPDSLIKNLKTLVDYAYESLDKKHRKLTNIIKLLPVDFERIEALKNWVKGEEGEEDGEYSWIFDNDKDSIALDNDVCGFDITYLLDSMPSHISNSVYMYLLHRFKISLDGRLTTIVMDEFKQILSAPYWVKAINTEIPTMRKKNAHFIFATQTPDSIIDSPVCAEVINNSATQVFIPNSSANENLYKNHLKLNDSEFDFVKSTPVSSRLMLIKQGTTSMICRLDLSDLSDEVRVLSGNIKTAQILDKVIEEKGENPDNWLDTFIKRSKKS